MADLHTHDILPVKLIYLERVGELALWLATNKLQPNTYAQIHNALIRRCLTAGYDLLTVTEILPVHITSVEQFSCWFHYFKKRGLLTEYLEVVRCTHSSIIKNFIATCNTTEDLAKFALRYGYCPRGDPEDIVTAALEIGSSEAFEALLTDSECASVLSDNYEAFLEACEALENPSRALCDWTVSLIVSKGIKAKKRIYRLLIGGCSDESSTVLVKWWGVADATSLSLAVGNKLSATIKTLLTMEGDLSHMSLSAESVAVLDEELIKLIASRRIDIIYPRDNKTSLDSLVPHFPATVGLFSHVSDANKRHLLLTTPIGRSLSLMEITRYITVDEIPASVWTR